MICGEYGGLSSEQLAAPGLPFELVRGRPTMEREMPPFPLSSLHHFTLVLQKRMKSDN